MAVVAKIEFNCKKIPKKMLAYFKGVSLLKILFLFCSGWLTNNNRKNALAHLCFSFLGGRIVVVCWVYEMLPEMNRVVFFTYDFESVLVDCETTLLETKLSLLNHWH